MVYKGPLVTPENLLLDSIKPVPKPNFECPPSLPPLQRIQSADWIDNILNGKVVSTWDGEY